MKEITVLCDDNPESISLRDKIIEFVLKEFGTQAVIVPGVTKRPKP